MVDREELAWAAGFFDGEGSTYTEHNERKTCGLKLQVAQTETSTLERFQKAVYGLGKLNYKPHLYKSNKHKPLYYFYSSRFEHTQAILAMLWVFLSEPKKLQALTAIKKRNR